MRELVYLMMSAFGIANGTSWEYLWWSGFFADVVIFTAGAGWYRRHNCHTRWCPRFGKHQLEGTPYLVCLKCHPETPDKTPTRAEIHAHWRRANSTGSVER